MGMQQKECCQTLVGVLKKAKQKLIRDIRIPQGKPNASNDLSKHFPDIFKDYLQVFTEYNNSFILYTGVFIRLKMYDKCGTVRRQLSKLLNDPMACCGVGLH